MSIITYPLNNIDYGAEDAELYNCTRSSGVFSADGNLDAEAAGGMTLNITSGIAWIRNDDFAGKVVAVKDTVTLNIGNSDATLDRIDLVVLRFSAADNASEIAVKVGNPSSAAVAPDIERTASVYELGLYEILVTAGTTELTAANVIDMRLDETVCGLMSDGVTKIPTATLDALFREKLKEYEAAIAGAVPDHALTHGPGGEDEILQTIDIVNVTASITLSDAHLGRHLYCSNDADITITVPAGLGAGFNCTIERWGEGEVNIASTDVTLNGGSDALILGAQHIAAVSVVALTDTVYSVKGGLLT